MGAVCVKNKQFQKGNILKYENYSYAIQASAKGLDSRVLILD